MGGIGGGQATGCKAADNLHELWGKIFYQCFQGALLWHLCIIVLFSQDQKYESEELS